MSNAQYVEKQAIWKETQVTTQTGKQITESNELSYRKTIYKANNETELESTVDFHRS